MACLIASVIVGVGLIGLAAQAISGAVYRRLVRTGSAHPARGQIISFVASFIGIAAIVATVVIGVWIFLSNFRFER